MTDRENKGSVAAGRKMFDNQRLPSRAQVKGGSTAKPATKPGSVARGRALFAARGGRAAIDLLNEPGTDIDFGDGAA